MTEVFTNYDVYKNGKMAKSNQYQAQSTGCAPNPATPEEDCLHNLLHMATMTQDGADLIFKATNWLVYCHPKTYWLNHHMMICLFLANYGITYGYDYSHDQSLSKCACETDYRVKNKVLDA